jgi:hypothetical protein
VPGVRICPTHDLPLKKSGVRTWNCQHQYGFISAEVALQTLPTGSLEAVPAPHALLLGLAHEAAWLLNQPELRVGPALLRQHYRVRLIDQGLASYSGIVKAQRLQAAFQAKYPADLLRAFHCELAEQVRFNWLRRLFFLPDKFEHPLRHLLLLDFLGQRVETLLQSPLEAQPFGQAPWPCLNPVSDHYQQPTIESCQITPELHGKPCGTFRCPRCEFSYLRRGPDRSPADRFRIGQYLSPGPVWEAKLKVLWADPTVSQVEAARQLGVDRSTLARQAVRLSLPFPPPGSTISPPTLSTL